MKTSVSRVFRASRLRQGNGGQGRLIGASFWSRRCSAGTGCSRNADQRLQLADDYVARKQFKEAIIEYRRAIQVDPKRADIHYKLAKAYGEAGDLPAAYEAYAAAADVDPSLVDAHVQAGQLLLIAGEFGRAQEQRRGRDRRRSQERPGAHPDGQRAGGVEEHDAGDEADGGSRRARSVVGSGAFGARFGPVRGRQQGGAGGVREGGRSAAAGDRRAYRARQLRLGRGRSRRGRAGSQGGPRGRAAERRRAPRARVDVSHRPAPAGGRAALQDPGVPVGRGDAGAGRLLLRDRTSRRRDPHPRASDAGLEARSGGAGSAPRSLSVSRASGPRRSSWPAPWSRSVPSTPTRTP